MSLFTPATPEITSLEERGKFNMAWRLSISFAVIFTLLSVIIYSTSVASTFVYLTMVAIALFIIGYLYKTKKSRLPYWIYAIAGSVITQITLNTLLDSAHYSDFVWIMSTIIFSFVGLGRIPGIVVICFHSVGLIFYVSFSMNPHFLAVTQHTLGEKIALYVEIIMGFITIGYLLSQYLVFQNYTKTQLEELNHNLEEQNETVLQTNKENITLVKEVHHRVKNNLQVIISLLRMQRAEIASDEAQEHFTVAINRILTMSMIHEKLYQEKEPSKINLREYLEDLINELVSLADRNTPVRVNMDASEEYTDLKTIVPFGLLVNELVANSMKHAFEPSKENEIQIQLNTTENPPTLNFNYSDNGEWLEPDAESKGFGLELIDILTEQMEGEYERVGSEYDFKISLEPV